MIVLLVLVLAGGVSGSMWDAPAPPHVGSIERGYTQ